MKGKKIIHTSNLTPAIFVSPILLAIVTLVLLQLDSLLMYLSIVTGAFMAFQLMKQTIRYFTYKICITDTSVVITSGVIKKDNLEFMLPHISGVYYKQGYFGRLFGFGNISLVITGITQTEITQVSSPKIFCNKLFYVINALSAQYKKAEVPTPQFQE